MNSEVLTQLSTDCAKSQRKIDYLVLHCSDTRPSQKFTIEKLKACHKARGFGKWPGYHLYVRRDGTLHYCRPISIMGCHVKGYNSHSIGVCYEGGRMEQDKDPLNPPLGGGKEVTNGGTASHPKTTLSGTASHPKTTLSGTASHPPQGGQRGSYGDTRTPAQKRVLLDVFKLLRSYYPDARIVGHSEFGVPKACPCLKPPASVEYASI